NPWRWSFDRQTGDLWIGDVGQNEWEEVDRAPMTASGPGRGVNWGWNRLEGTHCYPPGSSCSTSGKKMPLAQYSHGTGRCAVTGGYVYRGSDIPALVGWYVYGDYCSGEIWVVAANATASASSWSPTSAAGSTGSIRAHRPGPTRSPPLDPPSFADGRP